MLHVGKNVPRTAEIDKVTGHAVYIDEYKRPGMLHGKILYSGTLTRGSDPSTRRRRRSFPGCAP